MIKGLVPQFALLSELSVYQKGHWWFGSEGKMKVHVLCKFIFQKLFMLMERHCNAARKLQPPFFVRLMVQ